MEDLKTREDKFSKAFPTDWKVNSIKGALIIENNKRKPINKETRKLMQGDFPYYGPTKIQDYINEYQYDGEYALIAEDGDHFLKYKDQAMTQLVFGKLNVNNHAHVIKGTGECSTKWFYWFFNRRNIYSHLTRQGAGRYKLNKASLEQLKIAYPSIKEQSRIIDIIDLWDKNTETLQTLIDQKQLQKKWLMQQLLTGKKRLPGFDGAWEKRDLSSVTERVKRKNSEGNDNVVTISAKRGFVLQESFFKKRVASNTLSNYYLLKKGEFAYNKSYSKGYPMGAFKRLDNLEKGVVTTLYICFSIKPIIDSNFLLFYFEGGLMIRELMKVAQEGGRAHGLLNISLGDFFALKLIVPPLFEQKAIAEVLAKADEEIKLLEQKLIELKEQKKGLMQQLLTGKKRLV